MPFLGKVPSQIVDSDVDIDGGTIDGATIGSITAGAGTFTNLSATGTITFPDDGISGDDINGGTISNFTSTGIDDNATSTKLTITDSGIAATLTTAAQPNITSVGTLSSLSVTGELTVDTNTLYVDSTNNRVGVGTASPSSTLHLYGTGSPIRLNIEATTGRVESRLDNTSGAFIFGIDDSGGAGFGSAYSRNIYSNGAYPMLFWTNNAERMRIDSSGNVGIGITSMVNPLHVGVTSNTASKTSGSAFDGGALRLDGGLSTTDSEVAILGGNSTSLSSGIGFARQSSSDWGTQLRFYTHGTAITTTDELTERMRIDASGNLLVGMTSASTSNDGAGIRANGLIHGKRADTVAVFNRKTSDGNIVEFEKDNTTVGSIGANSGYMYLGSGDTGLYFNSVTNQVYPVSATGGGANEDGTQDLGRTTARFKDLYLSGTLTNNGTGGISIDTSGNVGIGATSPTDKLHIVDSGYLSLRVESSGTATQSSVWTENDSGVINGVFVYGSSHSGYGAISSGEGAFYSNTRVNIMSDNPSGAIKFSTGGSGGSERMRIDYSGNLLVGTTSASGHFTNGLPTATLSTGSTGGKAFSRTHRASSSNNATVDAFRFLDANGNLNNGYINGHLYVTVNGQTGLHSSTRMYYIQTNSNGTSNSSFTLLSTTTRGTDPVSSIAMVADGVQGAVKIQITYINNGSVVDFGYSTISFIGQA